MTYAWSMTAFESQKANEIKVPPMNSKQRRILVRLLISLLTASSIGKCDERPNILWITAEDMSPALGCYGDNFATTPNIDRLAEESVRYTNAFATAPVCSPVRSTLITGCYAPSLGTHNMRSAFPVPDSVEGFPTILRRAGYYTSNNVKTDYNTEAAARFIKDSWDESSENAHWRRRSEKTQPFFSVFNLMTSHQSRTMVWPYEKFESEIQRTLKPEEIHNPAEAPIPEYYPDSPLIRRDWARFYDCVTAMDKQVGSILRELEEDNLRDNTIVFFFSDHGSGMPRHKRALLDSGMQVPLLIRFPEKWKHLSPAKAGQSIDQLVSFVDFPPTVLNLANTSQPEHMQGIAFLRKHAAPERRFAFGHRDRVDEAFDCSRSVRSKQFLLIRNYMPHISYHQPTSWPDQGTIRSEISRLATRQKATPAQWHYAGPTRPPFELYDCRADPLNLHNLANSPEHQTTLELLHDALKKHIVESGDLGFIPEAELFELKTRNNVSMNDLRNRSAEYFQDAEQVGISDNPRNSGGSSFWNAIAASYEQSPAAGDESSFTVDWNAATTAEGKQYGIAKAFAVLSRGQNEAALRFLESATTDADLNIVLFATRSIELLGKKAVAAVPAIEAVASRCSSILPTATTATFVQTPQQDLAMFISFSANAFLKKYSK